MIFKKILVVSLLFLSCKTASEFTGFSYDPPGVTDTRGTLISTQKKKTIGVGIPKIWISNEFEGARAIDFYQVNKDTFEVLIEPENFPINNSPWYSFNIWSDQEQSIVLRLTYKEGSHRYIPKLTKTIDSLQFVETSPIHHIHISDGVATFNLNVYKNPQQVSAHPLEGIRYSDLLKQLDIYENTSTYVDTVGYSLLGRPIIELTINDSSSITNKGILALLSRQHPPETSGYRTYQEFFNTLNGNTELAKTFRKHFIVKAYPILNPDGVVNGHWRHSAAGIDLNRDWINFNQPETRAVRDALSTYVSQNGWQLYYGIDFHSTNENIFYPILEEIKTFPDNLTQQWFKKVIEENPSLNFTSEEFDTSSPVSKNWFFHTFGSDALTFEVHDELSLEEIRILGENSANSLMQLLIEEWKQANGQ